MTVLPTVRVLVLVALGCSSGKQPVTRSLDAAPPAAAIKATAPPPPAPCDEKKELAPGVVVERATVADGTCLTLARIDPKRHRIVVRTAAADGGTRAAPRWAKDFGLVAVTNSSMFLPNGRSIGLLASAEGVNNGKDNAKLGGFLFFDPVDAKDAPVLMTGRTCPGFDLEALRKRYRGAVQNYRMLECDGSPIAWADEKTYSAVALAVDAEGRVVIIHSRAPHKMTDFTRLVATPALGIRQALYLEGGPEASLYVNAGGVEVGEVGSFETGFHDGSNRLFWDIPNVIGFVPR